MSRGAPLVKLILCPFKGSKLIRKVTKENGKNKKDIAEGKQKTKRIKNNWNKVSLINYEQGNVSLILSKVIFIECFSKHSFSRFILIVGLYIEIVC